jgi:hypothetical protein
MIDGCLGFGVSAIFNECATFFFCFCFVLLFKFYQKRKKKLENLLNMKLKIKFKFHLNIYKKELPTKKNEKQNNNLIISHFV